MVRDPAHGRRRGRSHGSLLARPDLRGKVARNPPWFGSLEFRFPRGARGPPYEAGAAASTPRGRGSAGGGPESGEAQRRPRRGCPAARAEPRKPEALRSSGTNLCVGPRDLPRPLLAAPRNRAGAGKARSGLSRPHGAEVGERSPRSAAGRRAPGPRPRPAGAPRERCGPPPAFSPGGPCPGPLPGSRAGREQQPGAATGGREDGGPRGSHASARVRS